MYTAIIAAKPGAAMIMDAIASIYRQTQPPAQLYIVVDAEEEPLSEWITWVNHEYPEVRLLMQPLHGMANAVAFGIGVTRTPYVAFLDSDDIWESDKQRRQINVLDDDVSIDAVTCFAVNERLNGLVSQRSSATPSAMFTSTTFRTSAFTRFGLPDGDASHYTWLYRWWSEARRLGIHSELVPYLGLRRRVHGENSWVTSNEDAHKDLLREVRRISSRKRYGST